MAECIELSLICHYSTEMLKFQAVSILLKLVGIAIAALLE